jgi:hypothetical protein
VELPAVKSSRNKQHTEMRERRLSPERGGEIAKWRRAPPWEVGAGSRCGLTVMRFLRQRRKARRHSARSLPHPLKPQRLSASRPYPGAHNGEAGEPGPYLNCRRHRPSAIRSLFGQAIDVVTRPNIPPRPVLRRPSGRRTINEHSSSYPCGGGLAVRSKREAVAELNWSGPTARQACVQTCSKTYRCTLF